MVPLALLLQLMHVAFQRYHQAMVQLAAMVVVVLKQEHGLQEMLAETHLLLHVQ
jgi:hypothetical protein